MANEPPVQSSTGAGFISLIAWSSGSTELNLDTLCVEGNPETPSLSARVSMMK
jgi:hypothetical protein